MCKPMTEERLVELRRWAGTYDQPAVIECLDEIESLQAELAAAITIMEPISISHGRTGITYGWCKGKGVLGFLLHGVAVGPNPEDVVKAIAAEANDDFDYWDDDLEND